MRTPETTSRADTAPKAATAARLRAILAHLEKTALRPPTPAVAAAEREGRWRPDSQTRYCTRCGHNAGPAEQTRDGCAHCRGTPLAWDAVVRLGHYENDLRDWLLALKFASTAALGAHLGARLGQSVLEHLRPHDNATPPSHAEHKENHTQPQTPPPVIVPVPTARLRKLARGIDHTRELARGVAASTRFPLRTALAARHHRPQHRLAGEDRRTNLAPAFRIRPRAAADIAGRGVILIDDVLTTGSTARGACLALSGRPDLRSRRSPNAPAWILLAVAAVAGHDD